jgi:hypothetical protein
MILPFAPQSDAIRLELLHLYRRRRMPVRISILKTSASEEDLLPERNFVS